MPGLWLCFLFAAFGPHPYLCARPPVDSRQNLAVGPRGFFQAAGRSNESSSLLNTSRTDEEDQLQTAMRMRAQLAAAISQHMASFLATEVSAGELHSVRNTALVSGLERHGISLEKQFQWFALRHEAESGLFELASKHEEGEQGRGTDPDEPRIVTRGRGKVNRTAYANVGVAKVAVEIAHHKLTKNAKKGKFVKERLALFEEEVEDIDKLDLQELTENMQAFAELSKQAETCADTPVMDRYLSKQNFKEYSKWKKNRAHSGTGWFGKYFDQLVNKAVFGEARGLEIQRAQKLYTDLYKMIDKLSSVKATLSHFEDVNWDIVEEYKHVGPFRSLLRHMAHYSKALAQNTKKLGVRVWHIFKSKLHEQEHKCVAKHQASEAKAMKKEGMASREKMAKEMSEGKDHESSDEKHEMKMQLLLNKEMKKADKVLDKQETLGKASEKKLEKDVGDLHKEGKKLQDDALRGEIDHEALQDVGAKMNEVASVACGAKEGFIVRKLRGISAALKTMVDTSIPTLGVRGIGGAASVIGGGVEEVIDFWNKEIGLFVWGSTQIGLNSATAGIGGYAGVGWKGYKLDWNLQEAYQTALFLTGSAGVPLPIPVSFGLGVTGAVDADDSRGHPWIPEPHGTNGLVVGWSFSVGPSLPASVDQGSSRYKMVVSECFYDKPLWKFIGMMWLPHCLNCTGFVETALMDTMRLGIKAASYPVLTDILHSSIAVRVHYLKKSAKVPQCRKPNGKDGEAWGPCPDATFDPNLDPEKRCSERSTRFRLDVPRMFRQTAVKLTEAALMLEEIVGSYDRFVVNLEAGKLENPNVLKSKELAQFWESMKKHHMSCPKAPRERLLQLAGKKDARKTSKFWGRANLEDKSRVTLLKLCRKDKECKKRLSYFVRSSKAHLIHHLLTARDLASVENPFGTCSTDAHCTKISPNRECQCPDALLKSLRLQKCPKLTGNCVCKEGDCFRRTAMGPPRPGMNHVQGTCVKDLVLSDRLNVKGMRDVVQSWVNAREFELGSAAKVLKLLVAETLAGNSSSSKKT